MLTVKNTKLALGALVLSSAFVTGLGLANADDHGIISKEADEEGAYCHLTFPAIRSATLGTDHPQLKSASEGDIIDFYGSCDHDPLGKDEVQSQEHDQLIRGLRNYGDD